MAKKKGKRRKKKPPPTPEEAEIAKLEKQNKKSKVTIQGLRRQLHVIKKDLGASTILVERLKVYHDAARPYVSALEINRADRTHPVEYYEAVSALAAKPTRKLLLKEETDDESTAT